MSAIDHSPCAAMNMATQRKVYKEIAQGASITDYQAYSECALALRLDLPAILDRHFPAPLHWKGPLTPGEVLAVWLLFVVSQGDHCLNHVEAWAAQHHGCLSALLGKTALPVAFHDDRPADSLTPPAPP